MRGSTATRRVARLAARQEGSITHGQLHACGLSGPQIEVRLRSGWLIPRHTRVYAVGHVPRSRLSRWHAAVLALDGEARVALSHRSAAAFWELVRGAVPTEVTVATTAGRERRDGLLIHRSRLPEPHVVRRGTLWVTTPVRTLLDLAAVFERRPLARAFEEAQVLKLVRPEELAAEVLSRPGYRGTGRLRLVLRDAVDADRVRSILELRFLRLCAAHGIPRPEVNVRIGPWMPDFLWPEQRLVVETDGYDFHRTAAKRRRDAEKDAYLRALGLTVIRLTWADVTERPAAVARAIRDALSGGSTTDEWA